MWIQNQNSATKRLYDADLMDEPIEFSSNGSAQVPQELGEALVKRYDAIVPKGEDQHE